MRPDRFTPEEEAAALAIAQSGADAIVEWMRDEGLVTSRTVAVVSGFDVTPDGRLVAAIRWERTTRPDGLD